MATVPLSQLIGLPIAMDVVIDDGDDDSAGTPQPNLPWPFNSTGSSGTASGQTSGGTWTSLPIPGASGTPIPVPSTSTGNGNVTTSTGNAGAIGHLVNTLNNVGTAKTQTIVKDRIRIIIQKADGSQLVLEEQSVVTPQEMVGLSKFFMLMSCVNQVYTAAGSGYNIKINWSELIKTLSIERHFVAPLSTSGVSATNVLDITLFDPT